MMKKLENKSGNLKEILCAIADGKEVQFFGKQSMSWIDNTSPLFALSPEGLSREWQIKPDAKELAWDEEAEKCLVWDGCAEYRLFKSYFYKGWDAAIAHKEQQ